MSQKNLKTFVKQMILGVFDAKMSTTSTVNGLTALVVELVRQEKEDEKIKTLESLKNLIDQLCQNGRPKATFLRTKKQK